MHLRWLGKVAGSDREDRLESGIFVEEGSIPIDRFHLLSTSRVSGLMWAAAIDTFQNGGGAFISTVLFRTLPTGCEFGRAVPLDDRLWTQGLKHNRH